MILRNHFGCLEISECISNYATFRLFQYRSYNCKLCINRLQNVIFRKRIYISEIFLPQHDQARCVRKKDRGQIWNVNSNFLELFHQELNKVLTSQFIWLTYRNILYFRTHFLIKEQNFCQMNKRQRRWHYKEFMKFV